MKTEPKHIYVALLRGINVGGNNKVDMKRLCAGFERAGMQDVESYINSGNVIFTNQKNTPEELVKILEKVILDEFDLTIKVLIRDLVTYSTMMKSLPGAWTNDKEAKSDVLFLWEAVDDLSTLQLLTIKPGIDTGLYASGAVLWSVDRDDVGKSGLQDLVKLPLYKQVTIRNVNTTRKIYALMQARV